MSIAKKTNSINSNIPSNLKFPWQKNNSKVGSRNISSIVNKLLHNKLLSTDDRSVINTSFWSPGAPYADVPVPRVNKQPINAMGIEITKGHAQVNAVLQSSGFLIPTNKYYTTHGQIIPKYEDPIKKGRQYIWKSFVNMFNNNDQDMLSKLNKIISYLYPIYDLLINLNVTKLTALLKSGFELFIHAFSFRLDSTWNVSDYIESIINALVDGVYTVALPTTKAQFSAEGTSFSMFDPAKHITITIFGVEYGFYVIPYTFIIIPDWLADTVFPTSDTWDYGDEEKESSTVLEVVTDLLFLLSIVITLALIAIYAPSQISTVISIVTALFAKWQASRKFKHLSELMNYCVGFAYKLMTYIMDPLHNEKPTQMNSEDLYDGDYNP